MHQEDDPDHPESVPVQDFLDELRDRFERVDMSWDPINLQVTLDPEFVLGILERVPEVPPTPKGQDDLKVEPLRLSLGTGLSRGVTWKDIEVVRGGGPPRLELHGGAAQRAATMQVRRSLVSITHSDSLAMAQVMLIGD